VKTKRIFVRDVPGLDIKYQPACGVYLLRFGLRELTPDIYTYPVYVLVEGGAIFELTSDCIFCESGGGTTTRPDFWPDMK
jgi:hypothetical protein